MMTLKVYKYIIGLFFSVFIIPGQNILLVSESMNTVDTLELDEIELIENRKKLSQFEYSKDVFNYQIYSGKKNELIILDNKSSLSLNNARQLYNQTVSLNIYETDDVGLQLNIGGRGLNPKRTSNFNVRQNYYDISADPLGYPESYYVPPFECLSSVELIRGAASLQYGTQFGGFLNFNIKKPIRNKKIEILTRNTLASNSMFSNFTSISGSVKNVGYYIFNNYKKGDGFRDNSQYESENFYSFLSYRINDNINISFEFTYLDYLAQQPGGLTDFMFDENIFQSNRERNWFKVKWLLYNSQFSYNISESTHISLNAFMLNAARYAVGFRTNRVDQLDSFEERDLLVTNFDNIGIETKIMHRYNFFKYKSVLLLGNKLFTGKNSTEQGPGSNGFDPNFDYQYALYPNYSDQSHYSNPNKNAAFFVENIFYFNDKLNIIPGVRFEFIETNSNGYYRNINTDAAGNVILNELINSNSKNTRSFLLCGLGSSYSPFEAFEIYSNLSQNYRAVTFADINIVNPSFIIDPNIGDENGYTFDFGIRGNINQKIIYDLSLFHIFYNNRIGFIQRAFSDGSVKNEKGNVGDAQISGYESLLSFSLHDILNFKSFDFVYYINTSFINSEYIDSRENGVVGNSVEFVPKLNFKTGLKLHYKRLIANLQYSYLDSQFTDATNSINSDLSGVIGQIPAYNVLDLSLLYEFNNLKLEFGVNNLLDNYYFTTRATGYPGPGIIPSINRNYYFTLEFKF